MIPPLTSLSAFVERLATQKWSQVLFIGLMALPVVVFATIDLPLGVHWMLCGTLMAVGYWIASRRPDLRLALMFLSAGVSLRYILWRGNYTLGLDKPGDLALAFSLFAAEVYGVIVLLAGYFQTVVLRPRRPVPLPDDTMRWPWVDVMIPTYDESAEIVRRTLIGAMAMSYPHKRIYLLDDGRRPAMRALAESLGVEYRVRSNNAHAKAGNINTALTTTDGDLVAIFDCDHVPVRSFLNVTVGLFIADPNMALVQTPHHFYNPDPFERNLWLEGQMPPEQQVFYHSVQIGNDFWNSVLFCGSCAVLRRTALVGVGGIAQETVTEDAHTSMRLAAAGWTSSYLDVPLAAGLATERYAYHIAQRIRWARGMTQILRLDSPLFKPGLTLAQRLNYFNAIQHFQFGIPRLIFMVAPALYLLFGVHPLAATPGEVLSYGVPHMFLSVLGGLACARSMRHAFWAEVYEVALAPYCALVTTLAWIAPRRGKFNVTVKGAPLAHAQYDWRRAWPNLVLLVGVVAATLVAPGRILDSPLEGETLAISLVFNLFNLAVLITALAVALERPQQRTEHRVRRSFVAEVETDDGEYLPARTLDLCESGARVTLQGAELGSDVGWLRIERWDGWTAPMRFKVQNVMQGPDSPLLGLQFQDLTEFDRRLIVELMFSEPDSWSVEASPSTPLSSIKSLVGAPWRAARATWRRSRASA